MKNYILKILPIFLGSTVLPAQEYCMLEESFQAMKCQTENQKSNFGIFLRKDFEILIQRLNQSEHTLKALQAMNLERNGMELSYQELRHIIDEAIQESKQSRGQKK